MIELPEASVKIILNLLYQQRP